MRKHLKSQKYAWSGLFKIFDHERNFRIELIAAVFAITISHLLEITNVEFAIIFFCVGLVLILETMNGIVELLCDLITLEHHKDIEYAKDAMAGAVLMAALTSVVVGCLIWMPYLIEIISG